MSPWVRRSGYALMALGLSMLALARGGHLAGLAPLARLALVFVPASVGALVVLNDWLIRRLYARIDAAKVRMEAGEAPAPPRDDAR